MNKRAKAAFEGWVYSSHSIKYSFVDSLLDYVKFWADDIEFIESFVRKLPHDLKKKFHEQAKYGNFSVPEVQPFKVTMSLKKPLPRLERKTVDKKEFLGRPLNAITLIKISYKSKEVEHTMHVPFVLFVLTEFLKEDNNKRLLQRDIFRLNGDLRQQDQLKKHLSLADWSILEQFKYKGIEIAYFYKHVLNELTEPVIPFANYAAFIKKTKYHVKDTKTNEENVEAVLLFLDVLEKINRDTMLYVCSLLKLVADNGKVTGQSYESLAKMIGPSVFRPNKISKDDVLFGKVILNTFAFIIKNVDELKSKAMESEIEES